MNSVADKKTGRDYSSAYEWEFDDLVRGRRAGHMGQYEYDDESMPLWAKFLHDNEYAYYTPKNEIELIRKAAKISADRLGNRPVTLVSRGCGTKFLEKEGALIAHIPNIVGVVYLDRSEAALKQSVAEGKQLLPKAWHRTLRADIYDPALRYPVEGTELGVLFGLTLMNVEGFPDQAPPRQAYIKNMKAIYAQMRPGAHFVTSVDHNQDAASIEASYAGQTEFAKDMLRRTESISPDDVDFIVKYHAESQTLAHGFRFINDAEIFSRSGIRQFHAGDILWFNNSVKPTLESTEEWNRSAGFTYARMERPMDSQNRLAWHHLIKD